MKPKREEIENYRARRARMTEDEKKREDRYIADAMGRISPNIPIDYRAQDLRDEL